MKFVVAIVAGIVIGVLGYALPFYLAHGQTHTKPKPLIAPEVSLRLTYTDHDMAQNVLTWMNQAENMATPCHAHINELGRIFSHFVTGQSQAVDYRAAAMRMDTDCALGQLPSIETSQLADPELNQLYQSFIAAMQSMDLPAQQIIRASQQMQDLANPTMAPVQNAVDAWALYQKRLKSMKAIYSKVLTLAPVTNKSTSHLPFWG